MALVGDNLNYVGGVTCLLENPCVGTQEIRSDIQVFISDHSRSVLIGSPSVSGMMVTARAETTNDAVRASGLDRVVYDFTGDVQDGKLTNLHTVQDDRDPQTAAFQAFLRARQPNAAISVPALTQHVADRWYLEPPAAVSAPDLSNQVRDTWYVDK